MKIARSPRIRLVWRRLRSTTRDASRNGSRRLGRRGHQNASEAKKFLSAFYPSLARGLGFSPRGRYRSEKRELVRASRTRAAVVRASASPRTSCVRGKRWAARDGDAWRLPAALGLHEAAPQKANQFGGSAPPRRGGGGLVRSARCTSATSPHLAALAALPSTSVDASRRGAALLQALANSQQPLFHG